MRGTGPPADKVGADPVLPRIHVYCCQDVDGRASQAKPGHDEFNLGKCSNRRVGGTGLANISANI
jgi:hypothetical protein